MVNPIKAITMTLKYVVSKHRMNKFPINKSKWKGKTDMTIRSDGSGSENIPRRCR